MATHDTQLEHMIREQGKLLILFKKLNQPNYTIGYSIKLAKAGYERYWCNVATMTYQNFWLHTGINIMACLIHYFHEN
jgi:hypothetical protein